MWNDRRLLPWGLGASLLLNVFLGGIVTGHLFAGHRDRVVSPPGVMVPASHVRALAPDEKKKFAAAMSVHRDAIRAARKAFRTRRAATEADIAAPIFDRGKVNADFVSLREAGTAVQDAIHAALVEALAALPQASRAALVEHGSPAPNASDHP